MNKLIGERPQFDRNIVIITVVSTLLLILDRYHQITEYKYFDRVILYLIIPMLISLLFFRKNPKEYGFTFGDWKTGMILTIGGIIFLAPIIWYLGRNDITMKSYYSGFEVGLPWTTFLDLIGWEFFFRGWILFGYARKFGPEAIWLQAVPFAMAHIGKPEIETISTIFGGFAFGWVAWRTRSFVWPFLIHWFIATFIILIASGAI